jgi:hypothetical protein
VASPDVSEYVDLALYDKDPETLLAQALSDATAKFPGFAPRAGSAERVLLETLSLPASELIFALNRLPGAVTQVLLRLFGVERDEGTAPVATATFTLSDDLGHTVPAGTRLRLDLGEDADAIIFTTDAALVVGAGNLTGTVAITGDRPTDEANGTATGTDLALIDSISFVAGAELATPVANGSSPESDVDWLDRGVIRLRRLVTTLVHPAHFTSAALEEADVDRATTLDNYDPGQAGDPGDHVGHVTVAVLGANGAALSGPRKLEIEADLEEIALANLDVHVVDPTITPVDVTATVVRTVTADSATVDAAVVAAIEAYLDPASWPFAKTVRRNELIALIDGVAGVDYVDTLTVPAADVVLAGVAPLADAGVIDITVDAPA